jgi:cytochrome c556
MTKNRWVSISVVGAAASLAIGLGCASKEANQPPQVDQLTRAISAPDRPGPPEPLSPAARALLKERMASHAEDMSDLVSGIMLLEYSRIITRADKIAADVNLSRPITQDATELNASLPEKFFVRQDDLKAAARALSEAARSGNPYRVAEAYGRVSETCVRCHADFRPAM